MANNDDKKNKNPTGGFQDPSGSFPRIQTRDNSSDVNLGSTEKRITNKNNRVGRKTLTDSAYSAKTILPSSGSVKPEYPYNNVTQTPGGHVVEYDDTPGFERVHIRHKNGSSITMYANGDTELNSEGSSYSITAKDHNVVVRGICNIIVESDANIRVKGNTNIETNGDLNQTVHGDYNLEVNGNHTTRVHGYLDEKVTGYRLEETRGNSEYRHLNNHLQRVVGNQTIELGGNYSFTGEGTYSARTYGAIQASFHGGLFTLDGTNKEGTVGTGQMVSNEFFGADAHLDTIKTSGDVDFGGTVVGGSTADFTGQVTAPAIHGNLEGTAKKAEYADTAGQAPEGSASPTSPSADSPASVDARTNDPTSSLTVTDVTGTSSPLIIALDRSTVNGEFGTRKLSTSEVTSRCRNTTLFKNGTWLVDQIGLESVKDSIQTSSSQTAKRTAVLSTLASGRRSLVNTKNTSNFQRTVGDVNSAIIPSHIKITKTPEPSKRLSPSYYVSHMLGGDSEAAQLVSQLGLTDVQIANNMQVLAYTVLEKIRNEFGDIFTITEGLYVKYENEKYDQDSFAYDRMIGLGCGIQFPESDNKIYFDVAQWCMNNLVFEKLGLSYIDYDPEEINEPTLLISTRTGGVSKTTFTEFNHVKQSDSIEEY